MRKSNKLIMACGAAALMLGAAACSGKSESNADSTRTVIDTIEEPAPDRAQLDSLALIFSNPDKKSQVASDSTYAVTESGLKYMIIREGKGVSPRPTDNVNVHYSGQLPDGTVFDSSYDRGEPITFPLNRVIPGWTEGLQLMKPGGKAVFYIPSNLAYGPAGIPNGPIGPNQDLIFTVELIAVE